MHIRAALEIGRMPGVRFLLAEYAEMALIVSVYFQSITSFLSFILRG